MKSIFWELWGSIPISALLKRVVQADVLPPTQEPVEQAATLSLGTVLTLGLAVALIVIAAFLVIRMIRKKHAPKDSV